MLTLVEFDLQMKMSRTRLDIQMILIDGRKEYKEKFLMKILTAREINIIE